MYALVVLSVSNHIWPLDPVKGGSFPRTTKVLPETTPPDIVPGDPGGPGGPGGPTKIPGGPGETFILARLFA